MVNSSSPPQDDGTDTERVATAGAGADGAVSVRRSRDGSGGWRRRTAALTGNPSAAPPDLTRQPDDSTASPNAYTAPIANLGK